MLLSVMKPFSIVPSILMVFLSKPISEEGSFTSSRAVIPFFNFSLAVGSKSVSMSTPRQNAFGGITLMGMLRLMVSPSAFLTAKCALKLAADRSSRFSVLRILLQMYEASSPVSPTIKSTIFLTVPFVKSALNATMLPPTFSSSMSAEVNVEPLAALYFTRAVSTRAFSPLAAFDVTSTRSFPLSKVLTVAFCAWQKYATNAHNTITRVDLSFILQLF